ncbi:endopolygalacturonase [Massilia sp. Root418]|uniref:glycoside hydrolase family 28 protein n=1 Tax=Massilia sp. Root418 TaxID=1736532 RepID=UPI0006FC47B5|nr:glycoside hydrolase family 28 protein [Massilia sp. Root418]KQW91498.1 endopolygalacturonase [Massilia sp. Root418]
MNKTINQQRRSVMKAASATSLALAGGVPSLAGAATAVDPWERAADIVKRLSKPLVFRKQDFDVTKYGAATCKLVKVKAWKSFEEQDEMNTPAPGSKDSYPAFAAAIAACSKAGGGRVVIPAGNWFCAGPIVLLSNVHVHLKAGAHIYFSNQPSDYAKYGDFDCGKNGKLVITRWQSNDCLNFSSPIYAYGQDNIALTGEDWTSIIDGQGGVPFNSAGDCWWTWKGKTRTKNSVAENSVPNFGPGKLAGNIENPANPASMAEVAPQLTEEERLQIQGEGGKWRADEQYLPALSEAGVPLARRVFGLGHYLRPSMVHIVSCTNVLLQGYQVQHTPFWQHHPVHCRNIVIRKVHAVSHGPNSDGFDPEACDHVLVEGCTFDAGDDCIAIKAGKNQDTQFGPSQNIVIQDCIMHSGHGAVTLGSEMAGGIQNVYAQNLVFQNAHWQTNPLNTAIRLKTNLNRGGYLRNFYVRNISIPNGVQTSPSFYASLPGSPIQSRTVATAAGAVVTFDCDYAPIADTVRTRPPVVENIHISNVKVGNVTAKNGKQASCYQAVVILGPVASDYNGSAPMPTIVPVSNVTISDCDFGTPASTESPWFLYNVKSLKLKNVTIGGTIHNSELSG